MLSICKGSFCGRPTWGKPHCSADCFNGRFYPARRIYVFDLKRLGRAPSLDWNKPLTSYSGEEIEQLGEAFLSCVSPKTTEEMDALKKAYEKNLDDIPF
jgi:hypothetical protein